jgi:glyoxylase-like metal-dependent hydrolase (beta-lactamase superfamily II)
MQLASGLHRLGTDSVVNVYLVEEGGEVTIVDAGVAGQWSSVASELAGMGRSIADVRAIVLTHGHTDHIGFAERARREHGWRILVHEVDAALARGEEKPAGGTGPMRPLPMLRFLAWAAVRGGLRVQHLGGVATFGDGATLDVPGTPRVILVPGHTPGSAALHFAGHDALLVGDALATYAVTTGKTGPQIAPFTADRAMALESLTRLEAVDARLVLPGHGPAFGDGVAEAVRQVRASAR